MGGFRTMGPARSAAAVAMLAVVAVFAGCGGGAAVPLGVAPVAPATPNDEPAVASSSVAGQCAAPRFGVDPDTGAAFPDRLGAVATEKSWVRAWIDETYLWFDEVPSFGPPTSRRPSITSAMKRLGHGQRQRQGPLHFTADTATTVRCRATASKSAMGSSLFRARRRCATLRVGERTRYAGVPGGDRSWRLVIAIDGPTSRRRDVAGLNAGLSPAREGESHSFSLRPGWQQSPSDVHRITRTPVQNEVDPDAQRARRLPACNDHIACGRLIAAVNRSR